MEISIDDIREAQRLANLPPYEGKCKVFIIDGAEFLSNEASNALLKILEEPPPKVVWLLLACEEGRLLPTIVSRCQRLELKPIPVKQIEKILIDSYGAPSDKAELLARLSCGCLGWASSALTDDNLLKQRFQRIDKLTSLLNASLQQRFAYAQELAAQFSHERKTVAEVMEIWLGLWHDLMLTKCGYTEAITNINYGKTIEAHARQLTLTQIKDFIARLYSAIEDICRNVNARLTLESLMLNMPRREIINGQGSRGSLQARR
jgi:DNA polymerase-3 subunit delta'